MRNGAIPSDFLVPVVRAYANFLSTTPGTNPPTVGINIASITRTAGGIYTATFTTPLPTATYTVLITPGAVDRAAFVVSKLVGSFDFQTINTAAATTPADAGQVNILVLHTDAS